MHVVIFEEVREDFGIGFVKNITIDQKGIMGSSHILQFLFFLSSFFGKKK